MGIFNQGNCKDYEASKGYRLYEKKNFAEKVEKILIFETKMTNFVGYLIGR